MGQIGYQLGLAVTARGANHDIWLYFGAHLLGGAAAAAIFNGLDLDAEESTG